MAATTPLVAPNPGFNPGVGGWRGRGEAPIVAAE
jgi:hypothetical protein